MSSISSYFPQFQAIDSADQYRDNFNIQADMQQRVETLGKAILDHEIVWQQAENGWDPEVRSHIQVLVKMPEKALGEPLPLGVRLVHHSPEHAIDFCLDCVQRKKYASAYAFLCMQKYFEKLSSRIPYDNLEHPRYKSSTYESRPPPASNGVDTHYLGDIDHLLYSESGYFYLLIACFALAKNLFNDDPWDLRKTADWIGLSPDRLCTFYDEILSAIGNEIPQKDELFAANAHLDEIAKSENQPLSPE